MSSRIPSFVKLPRHKRFNFKTRYYNAEQEELQQRIDVIKAEVEREKSGEYDSQVARFKMEQNWKMNRTRQGHFNASNLRIAIIVGILSLIFYYYLYL